MYEGPKWTFVLLLSSSLATVGLGPVQTGTSTTSGQKIKQFDWAFSVFRLLGVSHLRDVRLGETPHHPSFLPKLKKEPCCSRQV